MSGAKRIVMVAAYAENGVIGLDGDIPWSIPEDLKHFRAVTRGNTVVMGRRTFESIGHPLPFRTNVVVTRDQDWSYDGVFVAHEVLAKHDLPPGCTLFVRHGGTGQVDALEETIQLS